MKKIQKALFYWLPPILWAGFIFFLSSRHRVSFTQEYLWDFIIFKTLHMIEYAVLNLLLFRALYGYKDKKIKIKKILLLSFFLTVIYAVTDEKHQTFVSGREGALRDVIVDSIGAGLMYIYIIKTFSYWKKFL